MILVTGASGNVGAELVRVLRARGVPFRIGARKPASVAAVVASVGAADAHVVASAGDGGAPVVASAGAADAHAVSSAGDGGAPVVASAAAGEARGIASTVAFDFLAPETFRPAARGCEAVFLLRPPAVSDTRATLVPFIDAAREEGVRHVVFVSVAGAADNPRVPHHAVEQHLRGGPSGWTILRPGFFAQNLGDAYRDDIARDGRLYVPAGAGRASFIDVRDLAEVAANVLVDPAAHDGRSYTLTGPEAISFADAAAILSRELGRAIRYEPATVLGYVRHLRRRGMPLVQVLVQAVLHFGIRFGQAEAVDDTLPRLLGHDARTFAAYVHDHREIWAPA